MLAKGLSVVRNRYLASTGLALTLAALLATGSTKTFAAVPKTFSGTQPAAVSDLLNKAQQAIKQGHPEVAVIYLKNAEGLAPDSAEVHFQLGAALLGTRNASQAERELNTAREKGIPAARVLPLIFQTMLAQRQSQLLLNQYPAPPADDHSSLASDTLRARAVAQAQIGNKQEAVASLDRALTIARTSQILGARAQLAFDMGDDQLAQKLLDEAIARSPTNANLLLMKITSLQKRKDPAGALTYADTLVKVTHNGPLPKVTRAGVYLQLGQTSKAAADLDDALAAAPGLATAIFYKAVIRARAKDPKGAWALAQTLPREFMSSRADISLAISQMAMDAGQVETGIDILHSAAQQFPKDAEVRLRLARLYLSRNELSAAAVTLAPLESSGNPNVLTVLGQIAAKQKKTDEAFTYFEKANELGVGGDAMALQLATSELQRGNVEKAEASLRSLYAKQPTKPEVVGALILVLLRKGDLASAGKIAEQLSKAAPHNPFGPFYQGEIYAQKGEADAALAAFTAATQRDPKFVPAMYYRANVLAQQGELSRAEADLQSVLSAQPRNAGVSLRLAGLYEQMGYSDKAQLVLTKAYAANPTNFSLCTALERFYARHNRWPEALATVRSFLQRVPNNPAALIMLAGAQTGSGAADKAIETLRGLNKVQAGSPELALTLASAYSKKGDYAAARGTLLKAVAQSPKVPEIRVALVDSDLAMKDQSAAVADAQAYAKDAPGVDATQLLASVLSAAKRGGEAETLLQKALSSAPDSRLVIQLSSVLRANGKAKAGEDVLRSWISAHPRDTAARQAYALPKLYTDRAAAEQQLRQILSYEPFNLMALNNLAWLLSNRDPAKADVYASRALKLAPAFPSVLDTYGWVKWQLKDRAAALSSLQKAHQGFSTDPEIAYHYAVALAGSNGAAEARKVLAPALSSGKDFQDRDQARELGKKLGI